jgi:hypothetical protein
MDLGFTPTRRIVLSLILSCAGIAVGQNGSVLPPSGGSSMSSAAGSSGFGSVDYSVSSSLSVVGTGSSLSNVSVNATPSAVVASSLAGSQGGGKSSAPSAAGNRLSSGSLNGWNHSSSTSAAGASRSESSKHGSLTTLYAAAKASSSAAGAKQLRQSGLGAAARESGLTGNKLESSLANAKLSRGHSAARLNSAEGATPVVGGSGGGTGTYATDFPDSTENAALISPPDLGNDSLFVFKPSVAEGFPDLANYQFLRPTLHVSGGPSSRGQSQQKEDLYRRIERRLSNYREAEVPKGGLKAKKQNHPKGPENPFARKTTSAEDKLNKLSSSGLSY